MKRNFFKQRSFNQTPSLGGQCAVSYLEKYLRDNSLPTKSGNISSFSKF
ncbi:hypothetical protein M153_6560003341 [Pseudoloma neurophilia]|uniref:Uncharacterized protein n=1 Tax=Pseudoloma neurophilia TaxID=146866 RepID=A0A0R0LWF4_9MICR|nr:hypothetical protein M153_6560003341 [Pseudoloma neurophilia]